MADMTPDQLVAAYREANADLVKQLGSRAPSSSASNVPMNLSWMSSLTTGTSNVVGSFDKLVTGSYKVTDAFGDVAKVSGLFGPLGQAAGTLGKQVGDVALGINDQLRQVSQSGVYFGNNMGLYVNAVTGARMSLSDFTAIVKQNGVALNGLSYGMDRSAQTFLKIAKEIQEDELAYKLKATGVGFEEFTQLLTIQAANRKFLDLNDEKSKRAVIDSTIALATEMDNIARLTGLSRQQQQKNLEVQMSKDDVFLKMSSQTAEQQNQYVDTIARVGKYGKGVADLISEAYTGGVRSAEGTQRLAAIGSAAPIVQEIGRILDKGSDEERKRLPELEKRLGDELQRTFADPEKMKQIAILAQANDPVAKQMVQMAAEYNRTIGGVETQIRNRALDKGITVDEFKAKFADEVKAIRDAVETGKPPEGKAALPSLTINQAEIFTRDLSAAAGKGFNSLNKEIGDTIIGIQGLNRVLRPYTTEDAVKKADELIKSVKEKAGGVDVTKPGAVPEGYTPGKAPAAKPKSFSNGTLGELGQLFGDFGKGTKAVLHGKEAVITEDQFKNVVNQLGVVAKQSKNSPDDLPNIVSQLTQTIRPVKIETTQVVKPQTTQQLTVDNTKDQFASINLQLKSIKDTAVTEEQLTTSQQKLKSSLTPKSEIKVPKLTTNTELPKNVNRASDEKLISVVDQFSGFIKGAATTPDQLPGLVSQIVKSMSPQKAELALPPQLGQMIDSMQTNLKQEMHRVQSSVPTMEGFEKVLTQLAPKEQPQTPPQPIPFTPQTSTNNDIMSDMVRGIDGLNMRVERLITAVVDGSDKSIRALKSRGNAIA